ncbi:MAG: transposase [Actinobacteria bacterium]|nr:transposase [Actinomycetota bacterium]MCA1700605.1 transposase [Actinomycetota bacterium]
MRVTTAFWRLLRLQGVWVRAVAFDADRVVVRVALRRSRLVCPLCAFTTSASEGVQPHDSVWRHLDLGVWRLEIRARLRQLRCPVHGVHVEAVPFARHRAGLTRDLDDLVAWLATKADKTTISRLVGVDWQTVGRVVARVCDEQLDERRLDDLFDIGIDEIAWRGGHRYLTLVTDHRRGKIVWGAEGHSAAVADAFFADLDPPAPGEPAIAIAGIAEPDDEPHVGPRAAKLEAISLDMGPGYARSARRHAPQAVICIDPYHVVALANRALDEVRRSYWNALRDGDERTAKRFKDARWALLKNPNDHTSKQAATLRKLRRAGGDVWRAYTLKEALRAIFAPGLTSIDAAVLIDRFCSRAARSRLRPFVRLGQTIRKHAQGILAAISTRINNARVEALNNKARLITRRAYGFHSASAALALIHLTCGPITLTLPHDQTV